MSKTYEDGYAQALKDYEKNKAFRESIASYTTFHNTICEEMMTDWTWQLKSFYCVQKGKLVYKTIITRYDKGYKQAIIDKEKENEN